MTIEEKVNNVTNLFNEQKKIANSVLCANSPEEVFKGILLLRAIEVQKQIIISTPTTKIKPAN